MRIRSIIFSLLVCVLSCQNLSNANISSPQTIPQKNQSSNLKKQVTHQSIATLQTKEITVNSSSINRSHVGNSKHNQIIQPKKQDQNQKSKKVQESRQKQMFDENGGEKNLTEQQKEIYKRAKQRFEPMPDKQSDDKANQVDQYAQNYTFNNTKQPDQSEISTSMEESSTHRLSRIRGQRQEHLKSHHQQAHTSQIKNKENRVKISKTKDKQEGQTRVKQKEEQGKIQSKTGSLVSSKTGNKNSQSDLNDTSKTDKKDISSQDEGKKISLEHKSKVKDEMKEINSSEKSKKQSKDAQTKKNNQIKNSPQQKNIKQKPSNNQDQSTKKPNQKAPSINTTLTNQSIPSTSAQSTSPPSSNREQPNTPEQASTLNTSISHLQESQPKAQKKQSQIKEKQKQGKEQKDKSQQFDSVIKQYLGSNGYLLILLAGTLCLLAAYIHRKWCVSNDNYGSQGFRTFQSSEQFQEFRGPPI